MVFWTLLFLSLLVFDTKSFLALFVVFAGWLFWRSKNLIKTLFYTLLLAVPFETVIRGWWLTVVPYGANFWSQGYDFNFGISVKLILAVVFFLLFLSGQIGKKKLTYLPSYCWWLLAFLGFAVLSSLFAERFDLMFTGLIRIWLAVWLFFLSRYFFQSKEIKSEFPRYLIRLLFFFGFIGVWQFFKRQPLGLELENQPERFAYGFLTTDGDPVYRVAGFMGYPTYFASFLSLLLPLGFVYIIKRKLLGSISAVLGVVAVVGTFSRSAWITIVGVFLVILPKLIKSKWFLRIIGIGLVLAVVFGLSVLQRARSLDYVWSLGSGRGRLALINHSLTMIKNNPLTGVGINNFTAAMFSQGVAPEHLAFIYPVHNTFLLFLSELGLPAGISFIIFFTMILIKTFYKVKNNLINLGIWLGAATFAVNAQFHTLFNLDPTFDLLMVMLAYLSVL